jgi:hypothetical protein
MRHTDRFGARRSRGPRPLALDDRSCSLSQMIVGTDISLYFIALYSLVPRMNQERNGGLRTRLMSPGRGHGER